VDVIPNLLLCAILASLLALPLRRSDRPALAALFAAGASATGTAWVAGPSSLWILPAFGLGGLLSFAGSGKLGRSSPFGSGRGLAKGGGSIEGRRPSPSRWIDPARRLRLERAVYAAESSGHAEIVVAVLDRCNRYQDARWTFALAVAACVFLALVQVAPQLPEWALLLAQGATLGLALQATRWSPLMRLLLPREATAEVVEARARRAFFESGLHHASAGAAALLFVAVFERRFLVLADDGNSPASDPGEAWDAIVASLARAFRDGLDTEGLEEAIGACARVLAKGGTGHRDYSLLKASVVLENGWAEH
jgi:uncharacterized membrane protein